MSETQEATETVPKADAPAAGGGSPQRLQLSRRMGFDLQRLSQSINGLPALKCCRPGKFGNRHKVGTRAITVDAHGRRINHELTAEDCFDMHRQDLEEMRPADRAKLLAPLRGKNLACWCAPTDPHCHIINLLEFANRGVTTW